ncbi:MAG: DUF4832 domain-containing protein [Planctomycetaceae bacterium]|nr:DUF4832 domain-containing protein [Planctomycetaceae bacterium]
MNSRQQSCSAVAGLLLGALLTTFANAQEPERVTITPHDNGQALINPDMGWTMHFYSNIIANYGSKLEPSDTLDDFPGLSTVYLRLPWSFLEPEEGRFDWSVVDTPAQRWISNGKRVAFRVSCSESWMRYATPKWVEEAGAKGLNFVVGKGVDPDGPFWEPDYGDPVFLEKLDRFLAEFARRYDGNPNVAFIDVGSFGVWGEGHCWASTKLEVDDAVRRQHIDLYLKHFKKTLLAVSDDYIGPGNRVASHPLTDYMLAHGVTLRDDSICVQPPPNSWFHAELAQSFWPKLPVVLEHEHYGPSVAKKAWGDGQLLVRSVEDYHAAYMSIHWWPHEFLEKNREVIDRINRRLGYRLQPREISWPKTIRLGEPFDVRAVWANAGVAPCYPGGSMALTFKDDKGGIVSVHVVDDVDLRDLEVGPPEAAPTRELRRTFRMAEIYDDGPRKFQRAAAAGTYDVFVSVGQLDGTPRIALPLEGDDGQRRYRVGTIAVEGP